MIPFDCIIREDGRDDREAIAIEIQEDEGGTYVYCINKATGHLCPVAMENVIAKIDKWLGVLEVCGRIDTYEQN